MLPHLVSEVSAIPEMPILGIVASQILHQVTYIVVGYIASRDVVVGYTKQNGFALS
jgi:hypothetical protein